MNRVAIVGCGVVSRTYGHTLGLFDWIDIVACAGMYCMIGAIINGFEVPTPNGENPF